MALQAAFGGRDHAGRPRVGRQRHAQRTRECFEHGFASGGLSGLADIEALCAVQGDGIEGVICGRSIYTGALDFAAAQKRADELGQLA